jgi:hypothetical protein
MTEEQHGLRTPFYNWLKCRSAMIYRVSSLVSGALAIPESVWRALLGSTIIPADGSRGPPKGHPTFEKVMRNIFGKYLHTSGVKIAEVGAPVTWKGRAFHLLGNNDLKRSSASSPSLTFALSFLPSIFARRAARPSPNQEPSPVFLGPPQEKCYLLWTQVMLTASHGRTGYKRF